MRNGTIEGMELKMPVLVEERSLRRDSGGAGKVLAAAWASICACAISSRAGGTCTGRAASIARPGDFGGGKPGGTADYLLKLPGESEFKSMDASQHPVPVDSEVIVRTGGGGGWGDPLERDPEACAPTSSKDSLSAQSARDDYGVILREDLSIDRQATMRRRAKMVESRSANSALRG